MIRKQDYNGLTWFDLEAPSEQEIKQIADECRLQPLVVQELAAPSLRSKVDRYVDSIYLILHFPICNICYGKRSTTGEDTEEIDFVIGHNFLLTVHYQVIEGLSEFARIFNLHYLKDRVSKKSHAGHLFYYLMKHLYSSLSTGLDYINGVLKQTERKIFSGEEKAMVQLLSKINRDLLDFRWALKAHRPLLESLVSAADDFFGDNFKYYPASILGEYEKIWNMLENNRETFSDLRQTNDSLLSSKTNETIKVLTVVAFIIFPVTVVSQFFGMNTNLPFAGQPYDFLIVIGLMVLAVVFMFALAKRRRWF